MRVRQLIGRAALAPEPQGPPDFPPWTWQGVVVLLPLAVRCWVSGDAAAAMLGCDADRSPRLKPLASLDDEKR